VFPAAGGWGFANRWSKGAWGALGEFCKFSIKIMHFYAYFCQNSYFKAITHQLKAV